MTDYTSAVVGLLENALEMVENDRAERDIREAKRLLEARQEPQGRSTETGTADADS